VEGYYVNLPAAHKISLNPLRQTLGGRPRLQCSSKLLRSLLSIRYRTADHMTDDAKALTFLRVNKASRQLIIRSRINISSRRKRGWLPR